MKKLMFIGIFAALALSSNTGLGQVTAVDCTIDTSKYSSAIGYQTTAAGKYSLASGYGVKATAEQSYIFGTKQTGNGSTYYGQFIDANNTDRSFMILFEGLPVFFAQLAPIQSSKDGYAPDDIDPESEEGRDKPHHNIIGTPAVGIGTVDPKTTLDVRGKSKTETLRITGSSFEYEQAKSLGFYAVGGVEDEFMFTSAMPTLILSNNKVGVGTKTPTSTLDVNGSVRADSVGIGIAHPQARLHVNGNSYFNGNVGIGISTPSKKLHVQGDSYFSGKIGIGTTNPEFSLDVNGDANSENVYTNNIYFPGAEMRIIKTGSGGLPSLGDDSGDGPEDDQGEGTNRYTIDIITIKKNGRVGIGTTTPANTFHVQGDSYLSGNLGIGISSPSKKLHVQGDSYFNGNVGIGTTNMGGYKLRVDGQINCTEVVITTSVPKGEGGDWPDYVFAEDYNLRSLDEVASYIEQNQRLPEIPSAAEVSENGINLSEINTLLLKKVEELTLYILDLQKQVDELKKR